MLLDVAMKHCESLQKEMARHELSEAAVEGIHHCVLAEPGTRVMAATIVFVNLLGINLIGISGDLCPGNGVWARGVSRGWFGGELEGDYLAGKFLEKKFNVDLAVAWIYQALADKCRDAEELECLDKIKKHRQFESEVHSIIDFDRTCRRLKLDPSESSTYWYDLNEVGILMAIQRTYRRLLAARSPRHDA